MPEYSTNLKAEAKKAKVPVQTLIMADLMAIGYSKADAYNIAYSTNSTLSAQRNKTVRDSIAETDSFDDLLQKRKERHTGVREENKADDSELMSDIDVARDILRSARLLPDGKERAELMAKYYDIKKKIGAADDEKDIVKVWLPLTCAICPWYQSEAEKAAKKK